MKTLPGQPIGYNPQLETLCSAELKPCIVSSDRSSLCDGALQYIQQQALLQILSIYAKKVKNLLFMAWTGRAGRAGQTGRVGWVERAGHPGQAGRVAHRHLP